GMIDSISIFFFLLASFPLIGPGHGPSFNASMVSVLALGTGLGIWIAAKGIVLAAVARIVLYLVLRILQRSLNIEFGPAGWPFLSWRRGEGPRVADVFWPTYLAVAVIALIVIPLGIYILSWYPFFARGQFHNLADLVNYQFQAYEYHKNLKATHPYGSPAWSWPFLARPVLYYAEYTNLGVDHWSAQPLISRMSNLG